MAVTPPIVPSLARLTSPWGWRKLKGEPDFHSGIDLSARDGTPVQAVADGRVQLVDWVNGYGQTVVLQHGGPTWSLYGHLTAGSPTVRPGELVRAGQTIALVGRTGGTKAEPKDVSAPHLHFELLTKWPPAGKDLDRVDPTSAIWAPFAHSAPRALDVVRDGTWGSLALVLAAGLVLAARRQRRRNPKRKAPGVPTTPSARKAADTAHVR